MAAAGIMLGVRGCWGVLGLPLISGCSFIFMQGPPDDHAKLRYFDCVSNTAAPVTDTVNAAANGLVTVLSLQDSSDDDESAAILVFGSVAALYAASAIYGYVSAETCSLAKQGLADRIEQREAEHARRIEAFERQLKSPQLGCSTDADCKGDRICVSGGCRSAAPNAAPVPLTPAAPAVAPDSAPVP